MLVGGYTGRVRKVRDFPRARYPVGIVLWERCVIRGWCCGWHVILHLPAEWQNKIKMEVVFSYIVFATSGENVFHKTRRGHKLSSGRKRYPSPIKISVGRDKLLREF